MTEVMDKSSSLDFLAGGGEMGALIRAHDWSTSPLGLPETWPDALRSALLISLNTPIVSAVHWGPDLRIFYNDAYAPALAERHPWALGRPFGEVWSEIWQVLGPQIASVVATGRGFSTERQLLRMHRNGNDEDTYWVYSFAPLHHNGAIAGIFVTALDTTDKVLAEQQSVADTERLRRMFEQAPGFMAMLHGPEHVFEFTNAAFMQLIGHRDVVGKTVHEALPEVEGQGFFELLDQVFATGEPYVGRAMPAQLQRSLAASVERRFVDFVYQPVTNTDGVVSGVFIEGADVTERVTAEVEQRESEERFRNMADRAPVMMWVTDPTGYCNHLNARWYEFTGQASGAGEGYGWLDAVHPDDRSIAEAAFVTANAEQRDYRVDFRLRRADGVYRWTIDAAAARFGKSGEYLGYVGNVIDIDERREAEERLALSEEKLRLALDVGEIGQWDVDSDTLAMFWPPRVKAMFGISPDVPVTLSDFYDNVHPDDQELTRSAYEAASNPDRRPLYDVEYRTIGKEDGVVRWVAAKGRGIFDISGRCVRIIGTAVDITARKAIEVRLRELNEQLELKVAEQTSERNRVWEMSRDLFAIMGFDGHLKAINPAWEVTLGRDTATLLSLPFADQVHPGDHESVRAVMEVLLRGESVARFEDRLRHADGSWRWISWALVPEGEVFYAVGRDVTAEREAAAELEIAQEALRQSQKMEAMGQLTGGVAHDFNNLLTPIIGSLDMLMRRGVGNERERRLIDGALQSADRAKTLVQRLLAFARRQPLQPSAVDIGVLVRGMAGLIESTLGPTIDVKVALDDDLPPAKADPNQLEMALLNLAVNARDAMPHGGKLSITVKRDSVRGQHRTRLRPGHYVLLCVTDTGIGMNEATLAKAVEPFFSTKGIGKGTGLGLSMVHGLAAQLGGALAIESAAGRGTTIELWLPVSLAQIDLEDTPQIEPKIRHGRGKALLVDDEELVRMSTADMLMDLGFEVTEAGSAEEALRLFEDGAVPDLVVTDHLMPGMNGADLARALRVRAGGLPILIVSGYADAEGIASDLPRLTKPFRNAELAACIESLGV